LLAAEEQQVLAGLAVFCGGFDATAAAAIAGATLDVLAGLMDKALLRSAAEGRFQLHELLRQFAQEQLRAIDKETATRQQHSAYYLALLDTWGNAFVGGDQQTRLMEVSREIENIRAAWEWSAAHADIGAIQRALEPLFNFYQSHGRYQEGLADFAGAAARMLAAGALAAHPQLELLRTRLLARLGTFCYSLGDYGAASAHLEGSLRAAQALGLQREEALALNMLSQVSAGRGEYSLAKEQLLESLAIGRAIDDKSSVATALEKLAELIADHGEQQPVKQLALESLALSRELRRPDWIAHALDRIGFITFCLGEYHEAAAYYRESLAVFDSIGHQLGRGLALGGLGLVKWAQAGDETAGAKAFFEQSLAIFREIGHQRHIAERLIDLSHHASDSGDYVQAQRYALEALTLTHRLGSPLHMCIVLCCLGHASSKQGDLQASSAYLAEALQLTIAAQMPIAGIEALFYSAMLMIEEAVRADPHGPAGLQRSCRALELLEFVICYPSTWHVYRVRARRMSDQLQRDLPPDLAEAAIERGRQLDWLVGVETLRGELAQPAPVASA
jgi:tetratricopeptide (TPR) repeat protein